MAEEADGFVFETSIDIEAPPELVYRFLTEKDLLERWHCVDAQLDLRVGGAYRFDITGGDVTEGTFETLEPGRRLVYTWGFETPGDSRVEIDLDPTPSGTRLRLRHSGLASADSRDGHGRGWTHYTQRLSLAARGDDPGPDRWRQDA